MSSGEDRSTRDKHQFYQIKGIVEPFRDLHNFLLEWHGGPIIRCIWKTSLPDVTPVKYRIYEKEEIIDGRVVRVEYDKGRARFPKTTSAETQTSVLKLEGCRHVVAAYLPHLLEALRQDNDATVNWVVVKPLPLKVYRYHYSDDPENLKKNPDEAEHSVFLITTLTKQYIADFTIEQFGYSGEDWFLTYDDYMDKYVPTKQYTHPTSERKREIEADLAEELSMLVSRRGFDKLCNQDIQWEDYRLYTDEERLAWWRVQTKKYEHMCQWPVPFQVQRKTRK